MGEIHYLNTLDVQTRRAQYRKHVASLLRLIRRSHPGRVQIDSHLDTLHVALWRLGAFDRGAFPACWVDGLTGQPVVRDPHTLEYFTVDLADPMGPPQPYAAADFRHIAMGDATYTVH